MNWRVFTQISELSDPVISTPPPMPAYLQEDPRPLENGPLLLVDHVHYVQSLLQQPHAHQFLTMNGITWHITSHYGLAGFFAIVISGLSTEAVLHLHFDEEHNHFNDQ
ncbi:hypothetical protein BDR04DRAFT_1154857 [Suillus decipiens]|nr:hypothetical protein BDR04DRAFT_1154857 [Suillus decipiens]